MMNFAAKNNWDCTATTGFCDLGPLNFSRVRTVNYVGFGVIWTPAGRVYLDITAARDLISSKLFIYVSYNFLLQHALCIKKLIAVIIL